MLQSATLISDAMRAKYGLLELATDKDLHTSVEQSGETTDRHKLIATKMFGVPYHLVTEQQRKVAKSVSFYSVYS